jgi:hypothetical protein
MVRSGGRFDGKAGDATLVPVVSGTVNAQPVVRLDIASGSGVFAFICGYLRSSALSLPAPPRGRA